jgi:hypothetical protein
MECGKLISHDQGVFCANWWTRRGKWPKCKGVWCGGCYLTPDKRISDLGEITEVSEVAYVFPIRGLDNEDYVIGSDLDEKKRFLSARDGDHLCTRFQCDMCHFINITKRRPQHTLPESRESSGRLPLC